MSKALRALSSTYVERRQRIQSGAALSGAGKRAAFALFYAPLHALLIQTIARSLDADAIVRPLIVDVGCGTGAAAAGFVSALDLNATARLRVVGIDRHPWAVREAAWTYHTCGMRAKTIVGDVGAATLPRGPATFLAAFTFNELPEEARRSLLDVLVARCTKGDALFVVEPLAKGVAPWWPEAQRLVEQAGGRSDEWRLRLSLPPIVLKLDRAAGLRHDELTARTLVLS